MTTGTSDRWQFPTLSKPVKLAQSWSLRRYSWRNQAIALTENRQPAPPELDGAIVSVMGILRQQSS